MTIPPASERAVRSCRANELPLSQNGCLLRGGCCIAPDIMSERNMHSDSLLHRGVRGQGSIRFEQVRLAYGAKKAPCKYHITEDEFKELIDQHNQQEQTPRYYGANEIADLIAEDDRKQEQQPRQEG